MEALLSKKTKRKLPLIEQANRKQLPDSLSIAQIVELQYPKPEEERPSFAKRQTLAYDRETATEDLNDACNDKLLKFSLVKKPNLFVPDPSSTHTSTTYYDERIIYKDDLKAYLLDHESKPWPVIVASLKGLLANWWQDDEPQTEEGRDADASSQADTKQASTRVIQANSNDFDYSGLLRVPSRGAGSWFRATDDMARAYFTKHNILPNKDHAWTEMCINPPEGYGITFNTEDKHKNKGCLEMPGVKAKSRRSFIRTWVKYTAEENPFKPFYTH